MSFTGLQDEVRLRNGVAWLAINGRFAEVLTKQMLVEAGWVPADEADAAEKALREIHDMVARPGQHAGDTAEIVACALDALGDMHTAIREHKEAADAAEKRAEEAERELQDERERHAITQGNSDWHRKARAAVEEKLAAERNAAGVLAARIREQRAAREQAERERDEAERTIAIIRKQSDEHCARADTERAAREQAERERDEARAETARLREYAQKVERERDEARRLAAEPLDGNTEAIMHTARERDELRQRLAIAEHTLDAAREWRRDVLPEIGALDRVLATTPAADPGEWVSDREHWSPPADAKPPSEQSQRPCAYCGGRFPESPPAAFGCTACDERMVLVPRAPGDAGPQPVPVGRRVELAAPEQGRREGVRLTEAEREGLRSWVRISRDEEARTGYAPSEGYALRILVEAHLRCDGDTRGGK